MKIALTGATGFLGRYLVRHLASAGHRLRCWHRPSSDRSGFGDNAGGVERLQGELGDSNAARDLVRGMDAEEQVERIAKDLTDSASMISDLNRGPKNQIETGEPPAAQDDFRRGGMDLLRDRDHLALRVKNWSSTIARIERRRYLDKATFESLFGPSNT